MRGYKNSRTCTAINGKMDKRYAEIQIKILKEDHSRSLPKNSASNEDHDGWIKPKTPYNYNWTLKILGLNARSIKEREI